MTIKQSLATVAVAAATSLGSVWGYSQYQQNQLPAPDTSDKNSLFKNASYTGTADPVVDFEKAANKAVPAVVHIKTLTKVKQANIPDMQNSPFRDFFGDEFDEMFGGRG